MDKWEHRLVVAEKHGKGVFGALMPREVSWKVHYVDGKQLTNWEDITLYNYLDKVGEEGWEVVTTFSHVTIRSGQLPVEHMYVMMKKPRQQAGM